MSRRSSRKFASRKYDTPNNVSRSASSTAIPQPSLSAIESAATLRQKAIRQMITNIRKKVALQQQQFWQQTDYRSEATLNRSQKRVAALIQWRQAQRGMEQPVKFKHFIPEQRSTVPKWNNEINRKTSKRSKHSKISNTDDDAQDASAALESDVETEIRRSSEEADPYNALLTHGILNELRQDPQSLNSLTNSIEGMLVKMNEGRSTINDLLPKVETWATVFTAIGLLKYSDLRETGKKPLGVSAMVSELARIGADDVIERLNNTEACDKACAWIWNSCEQWKLPWEALNFAEQGHLKNVEKQFGPEMLQRVYQHIWSRDEMQPHKLPVLQLLATHGLHSSIRQHFGVRVEADACAWVWQRSRSWGQITEDVHGQKGLSDVRLLDLDKSQDRMLANVDEHVQEIIKLRKERRALMAEEESLLRRALSMCRRSKGRSSLLEVPRMRPNGPLAPRRDFPLGADPKGMLGSMLHYGRKRRMYSPRVTHTIVKKPKLLPPFDVPHVVPCMVDGCNTLDSYIRTHTIPWATVADSFKPVKTAQQTHRSVRVHAVKIPRFRRIVPVEAPAEGEAEAEGEANAKGDAGGDSSDSEDTSDAKYTAMHKRTLASLKTRLDKLWKALDHKRQQALERRRQGVEKRKMQRKNNRKRTLLLSNSAQKMGKDAPADKNAGGDAQATVTPVKRSAELFLDVEESASQPANKKSRSSHGRRKSASSKRHTKKTSTPIRSPRPDSNLKKSTPKSTKKQLSSKSPRSPRTTTLESGNARRSTRSRTPRDSRASARTARQNPL